MNCISDFFKYLMMPILLFSFGCTTKYWKNEGDSCVFTTSKPPLRRVINYRDNDLCGRNLPARSAPYPRIRSNSEMKE